MSKPGHPTLEIESEFLIYYSNSIISSVNKERSVMDATKLIKRIYTALVDNHRPNILAIHRQYLKWYIHKVLGVVEDQSGSRYSGLEDVDVKHKDSPLSNFPSPDDRDLAPKMANFLKFIVDVTETDGKSRHTSEELLDILLHGGMPPQYSADELPPPYRRRLSSFGAPK